MIKKLTLILFIVSFVLITQANAQTAIAPEKQAAINELVALVNGDNKAEDLLKIFSMQMDSMREGTIKSILDERTDLTAAEKNSLKESLVAKQNELANRAQTKLMEKLNLNETINEIAGIVYDKYYSLEEIREMIAFYKTPTGQKTLKSMAPLMGDSLQLMQERLLPKIPEVIKELQEEEKTEIERVVNAKKPRAKSKASE